MSAKIPVFDVEIGDDEINAVVAALKRGELSGSFGDCIPSFERAFADYIGCKHGIAVSNGTTALHLAVAAAGVKPGDEVLVSASTNIATALAVYHHGAVPVAVDSEARTWNLDLNLIESLITDKTKAIIPVHLFGHPVDMDKLNSIAQKHDLVVIEDAAEAHGAMCRGRMAGSLGDMACFSFYVNKIITTGEGGMVLTDDDGYAEQIRLLRNLAFTKPRFRHEVAGYNFRMTGYQAALGCVQTSKLEKIVAAKRQMAAQYQENLRDLPFLQLPVEEAWAKSVYWMYAVVVKENSPVKRDELMDVLSSEGIETRTFFCPMNLQPCFERQEGRRVIECPVAERIWHTGMYLPSSPNLTEADIKFITSVIKKAFAKST